jgi:hypothetical protein
MNVKTSSHISVSRSRRILHSFEVFSLDQALNSLLDHSYVGHEASRELLDDFGYEIRMVELFSLPVGITLSPQRSTAFCPGMVLTS